MTMIDPLDARLLLALDDDPEATVLSLARRLGVARNTVHARLGRLSKSGSLRAFGRRIDPAALGYPLTAFVSIEISQSNGDRALAGLREIREVVEVHATTGGADFLVRVVARSTEDLHRTTNRMLTIEGVMRTNTAISLVEVMPTRIRPLLETAARPTGPAPEKDGTNS
ncbi:Lrp/AsnC family transcriptional regulator [Microbacteriaceae bacterium VKM Ac-2855]|nr:Lrp/AsnC family transcriptional regulator [Microbacteriaceae bacterium VKM Ac-2855]